MKIEWPLNKETKPIQTFLFDFVNFLVILVCPGNFTTTAGKNDGINLFTTTAGKNDGINLFTTTAGKNDGINLFAKFLFSSN